MKKIALLTLTMVLCSGAAVVGRGPYVFGEEREWHFLGQGHFRGSLVKIEDGKAFIRMSDGVVRTFWPGWGEGVSASYLQRTMCRLPDQPARPAVQPGRAPLIDLDAAALATGPLSRWPNAGQLGGGFDAMNDPPTVTDVEGRKAVVFAHSPWLLPLEFETMVSDFYMPAEAIDGRPLTVVAWLYNTGMVVDRETFLCWSQRDAGEVDGPDFSYGAYQALQWYNETMHFPEPRFPKFEQWHQFAFVVDQPEGYRGSEVTLYVNGEKLTSRRFRSPPGDKITDNLVFLGCAWEAWWGGAWATRPARPYTGAMQRMQVYDRALTEEEIRRLDGQDGPFSPMPLNDSYAATTTSDLSWSANPALPERFTVYLHTDRALVEQGDAQARKGVLDRTSHTPGALLAGTTYFWRVDQEGARGAPLIWSFTTSGGSGIAPEPTDGEQMVWTRRETLQWQPNPDAHRQHLFFGTDREAVVAGTSASVMNMRADRDRIYIPIDLEAEPLEADRTYYWRVEQSGEGQSLLSSGDVWSFSTAPFDLEFDGPVSIPFPAEIKQDHPDDPDSHIFYTRYMENPGDPIISPPGNHDIHLRAARYALRKLLDKRPDIIVPLSAVHAATHLGSRAHAGWGWSLFTCASYGGGEAILRESAILMHEMGHQFHMNGAEMLEPDFRQRLGEMFDANRRERVWMGDYAGLNMWENIAVSASWWINDMNQDEGGLTTREVLRREDRRNYDLLQDYWPGDIIAELHPAAGLATAPDGTVRTWANDKGVDFFKPHAGWRLFGWNMEQFRPVGSPKLCTVAGVSSVQFSGTDALVADKPMVEALAGGRPWSVDMWVYRTEAPRDDETLLSWSREGEPASRLVWGAGDQAFALQGGAGGAWHQKPEVGAWQRLVFVFSGDHLDKAQGTLRVYVNGRLDSESDMVLDLPEGARLTFGEGFTGALAHLRVYNYDLHPLQLAGMQEKEAPWHAREALPVAGSLLLDLDARALAPCHDEDVWPLYPEQLEQPWLRSWTNRGTLAGRLHNDRRDGLSAPRPSVIEGIDAVVFDGSDRMVSSFLGSHPGAATIEAWVYPAAGTAPSGTVLQWGVWTVPAQVLQPAQWQHVALVVDDGKAGLWVNGRSVTEPRTVNHGADDRARMILGAFWDGSTWSRGFRGAIAQVRVHRGALTPRQVAENIVKSDLLRPKAVWPAPGDRVVSSRRPALSWNLGIMAPGVRSDLYMGTDEAEVAGATRAGAAYQGVHASGAFRPDLAPGTTYYWRVDQVTEQGTVRLRSPVWSFKTAEGVVVDLDMQTLEDGPVASWRNAGRAGGAFEPGTEREIWRPTVQEIDGRKAVRFGARTHLLSSFEAPSSLLGQGGFSVSIWGYVKDVRHMPHEQAMLSWGRRPDDRVEFGWGFHPDAGAFVGKDLKIPYRGVETRIDGWRHNAPLMHGWRHIAYTYTGGTDSRLRIYVDGKLNQDEPLSLNIAPGTPICLAGALWRDRVEPMFGGFFSEVAVTDRVLTPAQIAQLAGGTAAPEIQRDWLVHLDASGLEAGVLDQWPNRGTLGGSFAPQPDRPRAPVVETVAGRRAVTFDGQQTFLRSTINTPDAVTGDRPVSVEMWVHAPRYHMEETVFALAPYVAFVGYPYHNALLAANFNFGSGDERGDRHNQPGLFASGNGGRHLGWRDRAAPTGKWRHLAWVYSGGIDGTMTVYVDGMKETEGTYYTLGTNGGYPMHIGSGWNTASGASRMFTGSLAALRVYDYARTEEEIATAAGQ